MSCHLTGNVYKQIGGKLLRKPLGETAHAEWV